VPLSFVILRTLSKVEGDEESPATMGIFRLRYGDKGTAVRCWCYMHRTRDKGTVLLSPPPNPKIDPK